MLTQEIIAGSIITLVGCIFLYLQQQNWYRKLMFSGYWKRYNTPSGRFCGNLQCAMVIAMGVAICLGFVEFDK